MKKKVVILALLVNLFSSANVVGATDDDFLLSIIPSIIAGVNAECDASHKGKCGNINTCEVAGGHWVSGQCETPSVMSNKIRQLAGDWMFSYFPYVYAPQNKSTHYLRFNPDTIQKIDATLIAIEGSAYTQTGDFSVADTDSEVIGTYDMEADLYIVIRLRDTSGSVFTFKKTEQNSYSDCRYLSDGDGNIYPDNPLTIYHCKKLTKTHLN